MSPVSEGGFEMPSVPVWSAEEAATEVASQNDAVSQDVFVHPYFIINIKHLGTYVLQINDLRGRGCINLTDPDKDFDNTCIEYNVIAKFKSNEKEGAAIEE